MSNLDIIIDVDNMVRINGRMNLEKEWIRNLSMLPLISRKVNGKTRYLLDYDVADRSLGEEKPEAIPFPIINITVPRIVNDGWWIGEALSEFKRLSDLDMFSQGSRIPKESNVFTYSKSWPVSSDGFYLRTKLKFLKISPELFDDLKTRVLDDEVARGVAEEFMIHDWGDDKIPTAEDRAICMKVAAYDSYWESIHHLFGRKKGYRTAKWR